MTSKVELLNCSVLRGWMYFQIIPFNISKDTVKILKASHAQVNVGHFQLVKIV